VWVELWTRSSRQDGSAWTGKGCDAKFHSSPSLRDYWTNAVEEEEKKAHFYADTGKMIVLLYRSIAVLCLDC